MNCTIQPTFTTCVQKFRRWRYRNEYGVLHSSAEDLLRNSFLLHHYTASSFAGGLWSSAGKHLSECRRADIKTIRRRIKAIRKNKPVGPERISGEILKLGGEAMIPYLARLLDITMNNGTLPGDWKRATVIPIHKGGNRSLVVVSCLVCIVVMCICCTTCVLLFLF